MNNNVADNNGQTYKPIVSQLGVNKTRCIVCVPEQQRPILILRPQSLVRDGNATLNIIAYNKGISTSSPKAEVSFFDIKQGDEKRREQNVPAKQAVRQLQEGE